jgi:hypothetical protein
MFDAQLVERAMAERNERFESVDFNELCAEATPVRAAANRCRGLVRSEMFKANRPVQKRTKTHIIY